MEGTDVETGYKDSNITHDHTFFGNGCRVTWAEGGSPEACSTRIVSTYDSEDQKNGTYYQYQAASSGSGAAVAVKYTATPDSFCPLGWQLPYGGTGGDYYDQSRSLKYLMDTYDIENTEEGRSALRSYPISNINSGNYHWREGRLYQQQNAFYQWTSQVESEYSAYRLNSSNIETDGKYSGASLRCVNHFSVPSSTARWQEILRI